MSESPFDQDAMSEDNPSLASRKQTDLTAGIGIVALIRRLPRAVWLACSLSLLLTGSLGWYLRQRDWRYTPLDISPQFFSAQWWNEALVRNAGAALPEISGRLYAVAVENQKPGTVRIWVAGPQGFLPIRTMTAIAGFPSSMTKKRVNFISPRRAPVRREQQARCLGLI